MTTARTLTTADVRALARALARELRALDARPARAPRRRAPSPPRAPAGIVPTDIERARATRALRKAGVKW